MEHASAALAEGGKHREYVGNGGGTIAIHVPIAPTDASKFAEDEEHVRHGDETVTIGVFGAGVGFVV